MYNHQLRIHGEYLASKQTLPKNAQAVGNGGAQRAGSLMGAAEIVMRAASVVTIAASKSFSVLLEHSADNESFVLMPLTFKSTSGAQARTWQDGDVMARVPLPSDCERFVRIVIATDDAAAAGMVDAHFHYLPR